MTETEEVVGWVTRRSERVHLIEEHARSFEGPVVGVTAAEVTKFDFKPCATCSRETAITAPVRATAEALKMMFVIDGTEEEVRRMAEDFLADLADQGFTVSKKRSPRKPSEPPPPEKLVDVFANEYPLDGGTQTAFSTESLPTHDEGEDT